MAQSLAQILVHIIFSTKERYPFLEATIRPELYAYAATVMKKMDSPALLINGVADHVHVFCRLSKKYAISEVIEEVKTSTSKWIKTKGGMLSKFYWQKGYGAFSVSPSQAASVCRYVENQEKHHRRVTFQDEFRRFLKRHGVEYDDRYVWD